jgi:hypothetical protein
LQLLHQEISLLKEEHHLKREKSEYKSRKQSFYQQSIASNEEEPIRTLSRAVSGNESFKNMARPHNLLFDLNDHIAVDEELPPTNVDIGHFG